MDKIEVNVRTNGKYGLVNPGDILKVGTDIDKRGAERWVNAGIAKPTNLKKKRDPEKPKEEAKKPTSNNTVKEIKKYLDSEKIEYKSNMTKDELLAKV